MEKIGKQKLLEINSFLKHIHNQFHLVLCESKQINKNNKGKLLKEEDTRTENWSSEERTHHRERKKCWLECLHVPTSTLFYVCLRCFSQR
jgi:hypothetical protein